MRMWIYKCVLYLWIHTLDVDIVTSWLASTAQVCIADCAPWGDSTLTKLVPCECPRRMVLVFYMLWNDVRVTQLIPWECPYSACVLRFAYFGAISGQQRWFHVSTCIQLLCWVLPDVERYQGKEVDSVGVPAFKHCDVCCMLWRDVRVNKMILWECPHSLFVLRDTCFGAAPGRHSWFRGIARIQLLYCVYMFWSDARVTKLSACTCFEAMPGWQSCLRGSALIHFLYCVLHALEQCQGDKVDSVGVPAFNLCVVLYMLWSDVRVTKLIPWECLYSAFAVCFICFRCQGNKVDSAGVPPLSFCTVFYTLWDDVRVTELIPWFSFCIAFYALWGDVRMWEWPHSSFVLCFTLFKSISR